MHKYCICAHSYPSTKLSFGPPPFSLTGVIRTRLKNSVSGIFWIVILKRRQPSFVFRTKICPKTLIFKVAEFSERRFLIERGKNAMNPDGFMSILTKFKRKSSSVKSGSDDFCQARQGRQCFGAKFIFKKSDKLQFSILSEYHKVL